MPLTLKVIPKALRSFHVRAFATYYTRRNAPDYKNRPADWDVTKFKQAIKGETIKGYASIPVGGVPVRMTENNKNIATEAFVDWACGNLSTISPAPVLVPVPNSHVALGFKGSYRTLDLARRIAAQSAKNGTKLTVADALRWKEVQPKAHEGGERNPLVLCEQLQVVGTVAANESYVLIDDVCTSGGHLRACEAVLTEAGGGGVVLALCAVKALSDSPADDPWEHFTEPLYTLKGLRDGFKTV